MAFNLHVGWCQFGASMPGELASWHGFPQSQLGLKRKTKVVVEFLGSLLPAVPSATPFPGTLALTCLLMEGTGSA
jgi:hypothetical protein